MDGEAIISVSAAVVALVQILKWAGLIPADKGHGAVWVLCLSFAGVALWAWSGGQFQPSKLFELFAGWVAVATSAVGVYGFTRATGAGMTRFTNKPGDEGGQP